MYEAMQWIGDAVVVLLVLLLSVSDCTSEWSKPSLGCCCSRKWPRWLYPASDLAGVCSVEDVACRDGQSQPDTASIPHRVDFIFLIEHCQRTNATYVEYFNSALLTLASTSQQRGFESMDINYAIVLYSLEQAISTFLYVSDLQSFTSDFSISDAFQYSVDDTGTDTERNSKVFQYSDKEMGYVAVDKALQVVNSVLNGDVLTDKNSRSHALSPRHGASVHMVVGLGLHERRGDSSLPRSRAADIGELRQSIDSRIELILENRIWTTSTVALHFFFNRDVRPAVKLIGSSRHEVRYRDCTHLSKALTLKSLLEAESEASSLQAHMLALGRDIHVMELSALTRRDCVVALSPVFWSSFDLQVNYVDKCSVRGDTTCSKDKYCSPLHGCVKKHSTKRDSFPDDKVPLTGQLLMSHADLAKSAGSSQSSMEGSNPTEELSILKAPGSTVPSFLLSDVVVGKPRSLKWSPDRDFAEKLIKKRDPVVLKNSVVKTWAAVKKWDFQYLAQNMGNDTLQRVKCTDDFLTFDPDRTAPLKLKISLPFTEANMSTSSFFSCIQEPSHCSDGLRGHYYFGSVPEALQPDLNPTRMLFRTSKDYKANKQFMWISSAGMITHGHFDQDFNFFVQLVGKKRFTLWPSSQHELMYIYPRVHPLWHKSRVNFRAPDTTRYPNFSKSRALQVVVEPGDVLYVPPYTWHYVETLTPSVSLSTWSHDYSLYDHMNAIYKHDHKFDLIKSPRGIIIIMTLCIVLSMYLYMHLPV